MALTDFLDHFLDLHLAMCRGQYHTLLVRVQLQLPQQYETFHHRWKVYSLLLELPHSGVIPRDELPVGLAIPDAQVIEESFQGVLMQITRLWYVFVI